MKTPNKLYSVLLLYPDYCAETYGEETFYDWVKARSPAEAVKKAQRKCKRKNADIEDPDDMAPLLVVAGHHYGLDPYGKER